MYLNGPKCLEKRPFSSCIDILLLLEKTAFAQFIGQVEPIVADIDGIIGVVAAAVNSRCSEPMNYMKKYGPKKESCCQKLNIRNKDTFLVKEIPNLMNNKSKC
uniref:Uncharacterized protein n=1 Tax=Romanomermis culicivorax TaxID=13658 RepID=A0A915HLL9_ROMCU